VLISYRESDLDIHIENGGEDAYRGNNARYLKGGVVKLSSKLNRMKMELAKIDAKMPAGAVLPVGYNRMLEIRKRLLEKVADEERRLVKGRLF
jgi:hypothetical protein